MADFIQAFENMIRLEGGYVLHEVPGDRGGMTYAGVSRKNWPAWPGWNKIDAGEQDAALTGLVKRFYAEKFWDPIRGDDIAGQKAAEIIFEFAVNAGVRTSSKIAQLCTGSTPDGVFGPKTLDSINQATSDDQGEEIFILRFSLLRVFRYKNICQNDQRRSKDNVQSNLKFLPGWINRIERGLSL